MGGACSTYGREERRIQSFGREPRGKEPLVRPRRRWIIILRWIFRKWDVG
jgi:hypothetical protein